MSEDTIKQTKYPPPQTLLWELTLRCNCRCTHCAAAAGHIRDDELSTDEAMAVCEQIAELGAESVCFMGGEALLRPDWDRIALRLLELGVAGLGVVTNGIALTDTVWRKLEILRFSQVVISLDGANPEVHDSRRQRKGAHAKAIAAIKALHARHLPYKNVITSVDKSNIDELPAILAWMRTHASSVTWTINYASPTPQSRMETRDAIGEAEFLQIARFIDESRKTVGEEMVVTGTHGLGYFSTCYPDLHNFEFNGCEAGLSTLGLRSDGHVTGCLILSDPFIEGNVRERRLLDIWTDPKAFAYNRRFTADMLKGACSGCRYGKQCRGGCKEIAYSFSSDLFVPPFCLHRLEQEGRINPQ